MDRHDSMYGPHRFSTGTGGWDRIDFMGAPARKVLTPETIAGDVLTDREASAPEFVKACREVRRATGGNDDPDPLKRAASAEENARQVIARTLLADGAREAVEREAALSEGRRAPPEPLKTPEERYAAALRALSPKEK